MVQFSARIEVDYIQRGYGISLPENEFYETLGGLIVYLKEEIPPKGTKVVLENFEFEIKEVSSTKIERVFLKINHEN